jgi:predicted component of type VI protein secretion system
MHLAFDILKRERDGSFRWFEEVNDLESAQQQIQEPEPEPEPIPQPAPAPEPAPEPEPAPPAPQSDSNAKDGAVVSEYAQAAKVMNAQTQTVSATATRSSCHG